MSRALKHKSSQVPVTALCLAWSDLVCVGQGPFLKIYLISSSQLLLSTQLFDRQAIHGFAYVAGKHDDKLHVLAWGGRHICYFQVTREESKKSQIGLDIFIDHKANITIEDWIFDISFRPATTSSAILVLPSAVVITAHNELLDLIITKDDHGSTLHGNPFFSGPRCGLYSATMRWLSPMKLLVASGTAFGEIVIWSISMLQESVEARRHFVFTGHEGSIFGVRVSDDLNMSDGSKLRMLASCSDDRTIRIWNISELNTGTVLASEDIKEVERDSLRTTGFLNYVSEEATAASRDLCIASGMGHLSRIWDIRFTIEKGIHENYVATVLSAGEDATCQKWHLIFDNSKRKAFALVHAAMKSYHEGKNVWSLALEYTPSHIAVLTGGSDGTVIEHCSLFSDSDKDEAHLLISEWDIRDTMEAMGDVVPSDIPVSAAIGDVDKKPQIRAIPKAQKDCFRSFACIGDGQLLLTTNDGLVLLATCTDSNKWTWKRIASFDGLKGYSVACHLIADPFEYVFFGDAHGNIYYYHSFFEKAKHLANIGGKITKLIAEILPSRTFEYMSIVVTRHGLLPPVQLRINLGIGGDLHLSTSKDFSRWKPDFPSITSCVIAIHDSSEKGIIVGCRNGSIYSYSRLDSPSKRKFEFELPLSHGKEAVTAMVWMPHKGYQDNTWSPSFGWLYSVGRDGTLAVHHFPGYYKDPVLIHRLSLSFGPNLEGISIDPHTLDVSVWGFTSKYFVCQNVSALQDVITIECGGAHRIWAFAPLESTTGGKLTGVFSWVKAMKLNLSTVSGPSHKVIQSGGHGREIKACAIAPVSILEGLGPLIATGAEDTNIAISYYADWHGKRDELKRLSVLRKHVTGIQSLHWSTDGRFLFSCGGFEQFYVWHLRPVPALSVGIVCESKCPLDGSESELRITDFAVRDVTVQGRSSLGDEQWVFLITMIYSDSSVKVWKYSSTTSIVPDREAWSFIAGTQYTTACLTTAKFLSRSPTGWPLVTGATDGHLTFWSLTDKIRQLEFCGLQSLHQSSIKAMTAVELTEASWLIISGGDDNAIGCTMLVFDDETAKYTSSSLIIPNAHAAAITAISVFRRDLRTLEGRIVSLHAVTAGNDQMVKLWNLKIDVRRPGIKGITIRKQGKYVSAVADISSLAIFSKVSEEEQMSKVLICGVGTEIWSYDQDYGEA